MRRYPVKKNPIGSLLARSFGTSTHTDKQTSCYFRIKTIPTEGEDFFYRNDSLGRVRYLSSK